MRWECSVLRHFGGCPAAPMLKPGLSRDVDVLVGALGDAAADDGEVLLLVRARGVGVDEGGLAGLAGRRSGRSALPSPAGCHQGASVPLCSRICFQIDDLVEERNSRRRPQGPHSAWVMPMTWTSAPVGGRRRRSRRAGRRRLQRTAARGGMCGSERPMAWWIAKAAEGKAERRRIKNPSAASQPWPVTPRTTAMPNTHLGLPYGQPGQRTVRRAPPNSQRCPPRYRKPRLDRAKRARPLNHRHLPPRPPWPQPVAMPARRG